MSFLYTPFTTPQVALSDFVAHFRQQPLPGAQLESLLTERRAARRRTSRVLQVSWGLEVGVQCVGWCVEVYVDMDWPALLMAFIHTDPCHS